jgi:anti-anti-sigma regulatory factor
MEAATQSQAPQPAPGGPPQKIAIEKFADGGIVCLRLSGTIDESFEGKKLATTIKAKTLVLDLADIKKISSFGIREWVDFIRNVGEHVEEIVLIECAPKVVDQLNMVGNFAGKGRVLSFAAPFRCDYCDNDARVLFSVDRDWDVIKSMKPAERPCDKCGEPQYFDEDPATYFAYIIGQGAFELDGEVAAFLSSKLNYAVSDASRKLRVDKIIEGRSTYLKLAGDLDASFPREKLAEGLEGTVIVEVSGIGKIEPAGAAEWRGFLQMVSPSAESIYLLGVPPVFLEKLTRPEDLGPKGQVITFSIPYTCNTCSTTSLQPVDVEQHYDVLKFATPPETRCGDCKNPMVCAASEALLSHLTTLPKPTITADTKKFIKEVRDRKPEKKKVATTVAEVAATSRGGGFLMPLLAALVAGVVIVGGLLVYTNMKSNKPRSQGVGKLVAKGADERPAWLTGDAANSSYCNDTDGGGMSCVGVSPVAGTQEDAATDADAAALEAIANGLVVRMHDEKWDRMAGLWSQTRQARMAEYEKDPTASAPRRAISDGRKQVAALLKTTAGSVIPAAPTGKYWEQYDNAGTQQFLAFAQYQLSPSDVKGLVEKYNHTEQALGATVATVYPMVAWRYPQVDKGAVIVALDTGPIQKMGLASEFVILGIGNDENALRTVANAADFAEAAKQSYDKIEKPGGKMFVSVERGADEPKVYDLSVDAPKVETPDTGSHGTGSHGTGTSGSHGTGSVNVWDRYGNNGSGNKDDPTQ